MNEDNHDLRLLCSLEHFITNQKEYQPETVSKVEEVMEAYLKKNSRQKNSGSSTETRPKERNLNDQNGSQTHQHVKENNLLQQLMSGEKNRLECESEKALQELQRMVRQFQEQEVIIKAINKKSMREEGGNGRKPNALGELCREVIVELSQHRSVEQYLLRQRELEKAMQIENGRMIQFLGEYFNKIDDIINEQQNY